MRRAHRLDSNHAELVMAFEKLGCSVLSLAGLGSGAPDICVGFSGLQIMCELKDGSKPPSARKLTPDEERFRMNWKGGYRLVKDFDDVEETVKVLQGWHASIRTAAKIGVRSNGPEGSNSQGMSGETMPDGARVSSESASTPSGDPSVRPTRFYRDGMPD